MTPCQTCGHAFHPKACAPCPPEPPVGTRVRDRFGVEHVRTSDGGWGASPLAQGYGRWEPMWAARGPLEIIEETP